MKFRALYYLILISLILMMNLYPAQGNVDPTLKDNIFNFVDVTVSINNIAGNPLIGAKVKAFSEDWGIRSPEYWAINTDGNGIAIFHIPRGNWTFYGAAGENYIQNIEGQAYFVVKNILINTSTEVELKPDTTIQVALFEEDNLPVNAVVRMMDQEHIPIVASSIVGQTRGGRIIIQTTEECSYNLAFKGDLGDGSGFVVLEKTLNNNNRCYEHSKTARFLPIIPVRPP